MDRLQKRGDAFSYRSMLKAIAFTNISNIWREKFVNFTGDDSSRRPLQMGSPAHDLLWLLEQSGLPGPVVMIKKGGDAGPGGDGQPQPGVAGGGYNTARCGKTSLGLINNVLIIYWG
ncbi:MAG: hypothetical protein NTY37_11940 [Methanothrix sp.]|nr:hypothetical protein [Methanothrix sp.]